MKMGRQTTILQKSSMSRTHIFRLPYFMNVTLYCILVYCLIIVIQILYLKRTSISLTPI